MGLNGIFVDNLFVYCKYYSCQIVLLCFVEDWKDCLDKDFMVVVILKDFLKVFDSLLYNFLLVKFKVYGFNKLVCIFFSNFLNGR